MSFGTDMISLNQLDDDRRQRRAARPLYDQQDQGTLRVIEFIANHLASLPGRKNLIWVCERFPAHHRI